MHRLNFLEKVQCRYIHRLDSLQQDQCTDIAQAIWNIDRADVLEQEDCR